MGIVYIFIIYSCMYIYLSSVQFGTGLQVGFYLTQICIELEC